MYKEVLFLRNHVSFHYSLKEYTIGIWFIEESRNETEEAAKAREKRQTRSKKLSCT